MRAVGGQWAVLCHGRAGVQPGPTAETASAADVLARLRLRPTRRVQLSAVSYQRSAASRNRKGSVCQPTSEPRPMLCLYRSCLHKPASATPRESPALMRHNGPRSARYFGLGRALQGNRRPLGPCVAARHWPPGRAHPRCTRQRGCVCYFQNLTHLQRLSPIKPSSV